MPANKKQKASPYLIIAVLLCILAVGTAVAILVLSLRNTPGTPDTSSSEPPSKPVMATSSQVSVLQNESPAASDSGADSSTTEEISVAPPVNGKTFSQPESTVAYERSVGISYSIDMNEYEKYICPADPMEYVFLVNKEHTLDASFKPDDLIWVKDMKPGRPEYYSYMREYAEKALEAFLEEGRQYNIQDWDKMGVSNAYRSYQAQMNLYNSYFARERSEHPDWTDEQVHAQVQTYSSYPGTSEHQSGLCADVHNQKNTDNEFDNTPAAIWMEENCYRFGFVKRYPADKTDVTGIMNESWHYRFVGRVAATEMHELGMCLEEYCAYKGIA